VADYTSTAEDETTAPEEPTGSTGTLSEFLVSLIWLATGMYTAHVTLTASGEGPTGALAAAAEALPGLVAATIVTGASIGHAAGSRFRSTGGRLLAGLGVGLAFGAVSAIAIRLAYGAESSIVTLAITVGVASALGGAAAALPDAVLGAGLWAATWVFFAGVIFGVWQSTWLGPDAIPHQASIQSVVTGLIAAVYASQTLRNEGRGALWYFVAGALPGLMLLAAEGLTRFGGSSVAAIVDGLPGGDAVPVELSDAAQLRHAFIVLAVGGLLALVASVRHRRAAD
jgi:hypothetical protein